VDACRACIIRRSTEVRKLPFTRPATARQCAQPLAWSGDCTPLSIRHTILRMSDTPCTGRQGSLSAAGFVTAQSYVSGSLCRGVRGLANRNVRACRSGAMIQHQFFLRWFRPQVVMAALRGPAGQLLARIGFAGSPETRSSPRCTQLASTSSAASPSGSMQVKPDNPGRRTASAARAARGGPSRGCQRPPGPSAPRR
jgi:hypothetical protein